MRSAIGCSENTFQFNTRKIDPVLKRVNKTLVEAVYLPQKISCNEQDIALQRQSRNKSWVKYKRDGDGFLVDTFCCQGNTYNFYYRYQKPLVKYMDKGVSALHVRMLFLFDQLKDDHHVVFMDSLYNSVFLQTL